MSINVFFRASIPKPHYNQQPRQSQRKTVAEYEYNVFHIQRIGQDKRHPDHQNSQVCPAQSLDAFCPVGLDKLGNGTGAHNDGACCSHDFKQMSNIHDHFLSCFRNALCWAFVSGFPHNTGAPSPLIMGIIRTALSPIFSFFFIGFFFNSFLDRILLAHHLPQ